MISLCLLSDSDRNLRDNSLHRLFFVLFVVELGQFWMDFALLTILVLLCLINLVIYSDKVWIIDYVKVIGCLGDCLDLRLCLIY